MTKSDYDSDDELSMDSIEAPVVLNPNYKGARDPNSMTYTKEQLLVETKARHATTTRAPNVASDVAPVPLATVTGWGNMFQHQANQRKCSDCRTPFPLEENKCPSCHKPYA